MEEQFIHFPVRAQMELHPEAIEVVDDKGSALIGTEFVGWLAPKSQREPSIIVLPRQPTVVAPCLNVRCSADGKPDLCNRRLERG